MVFPGAAGGYGGWPAGDGKAGDGITGGTGGGGGGMGGALFFRDGSLTLVACRFKYNVAEGGSGGSRGLGKGGAIFVYRFDTVGDAAAILAMLEAQTYQGNLATDLVESPTYDNDDYYVAQQLLAVKPGSPLDLTYRMYRQALDYGVPWRR
jgi:hypothetical protein